jgi:hypothetical protein
LSDEPEPNSTTARPGAIRRRKLGAALAQDRGLGAGQVILGQPRDRLEQRRSGIVVEPPRRDRLRVLREALEHVVAERGGNPVLVVLDQGESVGFGHHRSLASRTPVNCHC